MNKYRIISLIIAVCIVISALTGCGTAFASLVGADGECSYVLVRSADAGAVTQTAVKDIRAAIKENFACTPKVVKDSAYEDTDGVYEILVGETNRQVSVQTKQMLLDNRVNSANDFIIRVDGEKIAVFALNDNVLSVAVEWFIKNFCGSQEDWNKLYDGYEFIYEAENAPQGDKVNKIAGMDIGRFTVVLPKQISYLTGRQAESYAEYMSQFGYTIKVGEERDAEEEYEILIGDTERAASKSVSVEGDNYVIKVVGKKLVIKGGSTLATYRGALEFFNLVKSSDSNNNAFDWSDGYTINGKYDSAEVGTYTLNFEDDFESALVDTTKWGSYRYSNNTVTTSSLGGTHCYTNIYGECDIPEAKGNNLIYNADGYLHLGSMRINEVDFVNSDMSTIYTMSFRYGFVEVKAQLAPEPSSVSIWCNGSTMNTAASINRFGGQMNHSAMTEIDIIENFSKSTTFATNVHHWYNLFKADGITSSGNGHNSLDGDSRYTGNSLNNKRFSYDTVKNGDDLSTSFHIYSLYWDDNGMDFAFDGRRYFTYKFQDNEMPSVSCGMLYFILGSQMGSPSYGTLYNKNIHPDYNEALFDYVRIYQTDSVNSQMVYAWPEKQESGTLKYVYPDHSVNDVY